VKAHIAAIVALIVANLVAIFIFTMPSGLALRATVLGAVTGFFPIGWIVLNVIFLYRLTVEKGTFAASGLSLIANTAPVAFGALGTPIAGLSSVTGLDPYLLGAMVGRQLPFFSLIVPFWLIWVFAGWRGMLAVWPAVLVCGVSFAVPQFLISNFINPWIVDIGASLVSMACLIGFLKFWQPKEIWTSPALRRRDDGSGAPQPD
jgi:lactate permease